MNFLDRFLKNIQMSNFMKILQLGSELFHADRRTDRRKYYSLICNSTSASKSHIVWILTEMYTTIKSVCARSCEACCSTIEGHCSRLLKMILIFSTLFFIFLQVTSFRLNCRPSLRSRAVWVVKFVLACTFYERKWPYCG